MKDKNQFWQGQRIIDSTFSIEGAYVITAEMDSFTMCEGKANGTCSAFGNGDKS